ncbi:ROK family protein [Candidatus Pelagibacter sp.]|nr:ROK family protein [Candidatus Pelagibacter sp.]|tara:strand:+ start:433 stop:1323 length:891 start_codon:yes stop_codon:yes gene_type:complete
MHIGIDLGGTKTECIIIDQNGKEIERIRKDTPKNYNGTLKIVCDLVDYLENKYKNKCSIGIGTPGSLSKETNLIKGANSIWLNEKPLKKDIEEKLNRKIYFENDANCFALSEAFDGAGNKHNIVFGVIIGTGVGGSLVINKKIINGFNNISGEWGHNQMTTLPNDRWKNHNCYCGKIGCIETFLSGPGFSKHFFELYNENIDAKNIQLKANNGDENCLEFVYEYIDYLARGLSQIINIVDPDVIVLGGGVSNMKQIYENIQLQLKKYVFSDVVNTEILKNIYGDSSGVRGAASLGR